MIRIQNLVKSFSCEKVLDGFSMEIPDGAITVLVGPSGCGKTTLLRILAGLEKSDGGTVEIFSTKPGQPKMRMVFQEDRLLPWATIRQNLAIALDTNMRYAPEARKLIDSMLKITGLSHAADKYPKQLSGGMRKRAALARAFVPEADIILLDEPLQAVDWTLKLSLVKAFRDIWETSRATVLFVTHDIQEAALTGDIIHVLGELPMRIRKTMLNPVDRSQRVLYSKGITAIEKDIFEELTGTRHQDESPVEQ